MKRKNGKDTQKQQKVLSLLSTISFIFLLVAIFAVVIYGLYRIDIINLPSFLMDWLTQGKDTVTEIIPGDDGQFYTAFQSGKTEQGTIIEYEIQENQLREVLASSPKITEYYIQNEIMLKNGDKKMIRQNKIWRSGDHYRIEITSGQTHLQTIFCDGSSVYIREEETGYLKYYPVSKEFTLENQAGLPSSADFLEQDVLNLSIQLQRTPENNLYAVHFLFPELNQREEYYISLEYGIVLRADGYQGEELVYSMNTKQISTDLSSYDRSTWFVPD